MKIIYKLLILCVLCFVSNTIYGQVAQYSDDGTTSCIDCERTKSANSECFCYFFEEVPRLQRLLAQLEAQKREEWLRGKEKLIKDVIERRLNTTFTSYADAQRAFFKAYTRGYSNRVINKVRTDALKETTDAKNALDKSYYKSAILLSHKTKLRLGTPLDFGALKVDNNYINNITSQQVDAILNSEADKRRPIMINSFFNKAGIFDGLNKIENSGALEERIVDGFMNHYNSFDFMNRVQLMAKYLIWQNNGQVVGNTLNTIYPSPPYLYEVGNYNYHAIAEAMALAIGSDTNVYKRPHHQLNDEDGILNYAISQFDNKTYEFLRYKGILRAAYKTYFKENSYSQGSLELGKDLLSASLNNEVIINNNLSFSSSSAFPPDHPLHLDNYGQRGNIYKSWILASNANGNIGFFNLANALKNYRPSALSLKTEGSLIKKAIGAANITWASYTDEDLATMFNLTNLTFTNEKIPAGQLEFDHNLGQLFYNNGYPAAQFIKSDFAFEGTKAIIKGGSVVFEDEIILDKSFVNSRGNCVFDYIKQTNGSLFRNTIRNFINNGEYDLKFVVEPITGANSIAEAETDDDFLDSKGLIIIRFNEPVVKNLDPIVWAANTFHEGLHAEIFRFVHKNDPTVKPSERARIFQLLLAYKGTEWGNTSTVQQIHITQKYIEPIAQALRQLDKNQYSLDHYMWFAWQGLISHAPSNIRPSQEQLQNWANLSNKVLLNNNIPCH